MKNALEALKAIYDNLPMILAIIAVGGGIAIRIRKFLKMTKEEKAKLLKEQSDKIVELVKTQLLALVSEAESKWGGGTGKIKKSDVWKELLAQCSKVTDYIESGLIDKQLIDGLIDEAVTEMQKMIDTNQKAKEAIVGVPELKLEEGEPELQPEQGKPQEQSEPEEQDKEGDVQ